MDIAIIKPCQRVRGTITVPGDKSISHRAAMMSSLASGTSVISGFLRAEDCLNTLKALSALGAKIEFSGDKLHITGCPWQEPVGPLDMGNSGTGLRLMAGLLAGRPWTTELTGDASLRSRPMGRIKEPLEKMGACLELTGKKGCAPIQISGGKLRAIDYEMPVASAQVKSCVLLAALFAKGVTNVIEKTPTRDHTEKIFLQTGIPVKIDGNRISVRGFGTNGPMLRPFNLKIPGDFSSAAFWLAAASVKPGSRIDIKGVGLNPRRTAFLEVLRRMGADIRTDLENNQQMFEPGGTITVTGAGLQGASVGGAEIPNLIDELPLVAVLGALAQGTTVISGARELRVKESDRIACLAANLRLLGIEPEEKEDGLIIHGGRLVRGGTTVESYGDHRIAMAMAILALFAEGPVTIRNIACVATSYPEFWKHLRSIGADVRISPDISRFKNAREMSGLVIAIDGPSASGKSTVSQRVAQRLNFIHVDSGSFYRGATWYFLSRNVKISDSAAVAATLRQIRMNVFVKNNALKFSIDGIEPDAELRLKSVNENVSLIAALPAVREWIVRQLRKMTSFGNLVMEGRDIGTAVFPEAKFKFYLDAAPGERARRRYLELKNTGARVEYEEILRSILKRDGIDSTRAMAPLKVAHAAVVIQSTKMSIEEVVDLIVSAVQGKKRFNI